MKKYLRLTCTVCKRDIDKLVDIYHFAPDQCTITYGCEGRLQPVEYRSSAGIAVAPEVGVTDWRPRSSKITAGVATTEPRLVDLSTGSLKQLVLAVPLATDPGPNGTQQIDFKVKADAPKAYRQYVFRREGTFSTISGVESGLEKKALRFSIYGSAPDLVEVYLNGVKLERGTDPEDYQLDDGTSATPAPPNTIAFNTPIDQGGVAQVDVIVSKQETTSLLTLTFKRNKDDDSRLALGTFENVSAVQRLVDGTWVKYYLFTLDIDDAPLTLNTLFVPLQNSDKLILLARKPYTQLDRYMAIFLPLQDLSLERDYLKFYAENGVTTLRATSTSLAMMYPPLRMVKFNVEKTLRTAVAGIEEQLVLDGRVITGPDA